MKSRKLRTLYLTIALFSLLSGQVAFAWGQSKNLDGLIGQATLSYASLRRHQINYCVAIDTSAEENFPAASIDAQIRMALSLWLRPVQEYINHVVNVEAVPCSSDKLDLKVSVTPETKYSWDGTEAILLSNFKRGNKKPFAYIHIDSSAKLFAGQDLTIYNFDDILSNTRPRVTLQKAMSDAANEKMRSNDMSIYANAEINAVQTSTYLNLIHEVGHAFGLCDTNGKDFEATCDKTHASSIQPDSVMSTADFFYLTADDEAGVRSVIDRFLSSAPNNRKGCSPSRDR